MLLVLLFAFFAAIFCADGEPSGALPVNVVCLDGKYIGDVTVTLTFQGAKSLSEDLKDPGVYYTVGDQKNVKTFPTDKCVSEPEGTDQYCDEECNITDERQAVDVIVVVPTELVDPEKEEMGYKIKTVDLAINVTNVGSLTIKKTADTNPDTTTSPEKDFDVINSINITHHPKFYNYDWNPESYCPGTWGTIYPKADCYEFSKLEIDGVRFAVGAKNGANPSITSNRAIPTFTVKKVNVYNPLSVNVDLYPGIYQGSGNQSLKAEDVGITTMTLEDFNSVNEGAVTFNIEGNIESATWNNVEFGSGAFVFNVTARTNESFNGKEVYCPYCTFEPTDGAHGYIGTHTITNVSIPTGSSITVAGWVEDLDVDNFKFYTGGVSDVWNINTEHEFDKAEELKGEKFHVKHASFDTNTVIQSDIHFSIGNVESNNTEFTHNVMSRSAKVTIGTTNFNGPVRHQVRDSLTIANSNYNGNTYYDHYPNKKYYQLAISDVKIADVDFVVSADNEGEGTSDIVLTNITCQHNLNGEGVEKSGWYNVGESSKIFLVRHMSNSATMNTVKGCNVYFKNNVDHLVGDLDLSNPQHYTYTADNTVEGVNNDYNHITVFDNAAYHVTTNIVIKNNPHLGYVKFNRVTVENQSGKVGTSDIHLPEVDPLERGTYGTSYPVNITFTGNGLTHKLLISHDDSEGPKDPTGDATGFCGNDKLGLQEMRDFTYGAAQSDRQNDDVNLTIDNCEIENITIHADSLKLKVNELIAHTDVAIALADSSSLRIENARFRTFALACFEALELMMRHSIFDGDSSIVGGEGSNIDMRTVLITNSDNVSNRFEQPAPFMIGVSSGLINLDHIKVNYGDLQVMNELGNINVVQAFPVDSFTKVELMSNYGRLNVTHPPADFYRDLNSIYDFESPSNNASGHEYAQTDVFAFAPAPTMKALTSNVFNEQPYVRSGNSQFMTLHGSISWSFANNLTINSTSYTSSAEINLQGFDNVVAVSSIYAMGLDTFAGFDVENLDFNKVYLVTVHDKATAVDADNKNIITKFEGTTCSHTQEGEYHDPFDACLAYMILPTVNLASSLDFNTMPKLTLNSVNIFMKDCSSSALKSLTITGATSVYIDNLTTETANVTMTYREWTAFDWVRGSIFIGMSAISTSSLSVTGVDGVDNYTHISLVRNDSLGLNPVRAVISSLGDSIVSGVVRSAYPSDGQTLLDCSGIEHNSGSTYDSCTFDTIGSEGQTVNFDKSSEAGGSVEIKLGSAIGGISNLMLSYAKGNSLTSLLNGQTISIKNGDRIIIDNHLFATNFAAQGAFSQPYSGMETPSPVNNNIYIIPSNTAEVSGYVLVDTNADGMLYTSETFGEGEVTTHKFNLIEQASLYLYVPKADGISVTTAGDNINLILSDIGVYDRIYTPSYLLANVLRAKSVSSGAAMIYSLQNAVDFHTVIGCVGVNVNKANADISLVSSGSDSEAMVVLQKGSISDLGVYTRNYKTIYNCPDDLYKTDEFTCTSSVVPCRDDECEFVSYIWSPVNKFFWVGTDYDKSVKDNDKMTIIFESNLETFEGRCPSDGSWGTIKCPNTPIYSENIDYMSSVYIIGQPKISSNFQQNAFKNNKYVNPNTVAQPVEEEGMPGWAIGLIVLSCIIAAVLIVMFVLKLLGKESISDMRPANVGILTPN